jgi:uncharacterized protein YkwD
MSRTGSRPRIWLLASAIALSLLAAAVPAGAVPGRSPISTCSTQAPLGAAPAVQRQAMLCLVNRARSARGLPALQASPVLDRAAGRKSADILRCGEFSHEACGRDFTYWMQRFGYGGCAEGENIAWGTGDLGSVRAIFRAWMHSSGHRENILGDFEEIGIALRIGTLEGRGGAHVWTQDFGSHC